MPSMNQSLRSLTLMTVIAMNSSMLCAGASIRLGDISTPRTKLQLEISSSMHGLAGVRRPGLL